MNVSPSKENILKKIRKALNHSTPIPFPNSDGNQSIFQPLTQDMEVEFAEQFVKLQGKFIYCINQQEMASHLNNLANQLNWNHIYCREEKLYSIFKENLFDNFTDKDLANCDAAITSCEALVARTGSIVMSSAQQSGRTTSVYAPVHICIAYTDQLVYDIKHALQKMKEIYGEDQPSLITFATGPSRTADIEKTLVVGIHGPKEVYCFLIQR